MLKVFICEDNKKEKEQLKKIIENTIIIENYDMQLSIVTGNPCEIIDEIKYTTTSGVYFLDVDLNSDINGIQLAQEIRKYDPRGFVIFITTHGEMSYLTFLYKVEAMDYIIKDNYSLVEDRVRQCMENAYIKHITKSSDLQKCFSIKTDDKITNIAYNEILFFQTSTLIHKVVLHTENRQIEFYSKMKDLEKILDESFCRCHTSYIVNKNNIHQIDKRNRIVYMKNGEKCLISTRGMKKLLL